MYLDDKSLFEGTYLWIGGGSHLQAHQGHGLVFKCYRRHSSRLQYARVCDARVRFNRLKSAMCGVCEGEFTMAAVECMKGYV